VPIYAQSHVHTGASDTCCAYLHAVSCAYRDKWHPCMYCAYLHTLAFIDKWHLLCLLTRSLMCIILFYMWHILCLFTRSLMCIQGQVTPMYCAFLHTVSCSWTGKWHLCTYCAYLHSLMCTHWQVTPIVHIYTQSKVHNTLTTFGHILHAVSESQVHNTLTTFVHIKAQSLIFCGLVAWHSIIKLTWCEQSKSTPHIQ